MSTKPVRIAMWSGPRNISTAMMRSWANRSDTYVCDEPLYAHYLQQTGLDHPGAAEIMEHHETDWRSVVEWLLGEIPENKSIFYQKHMAHHLLEDIGRDWLNEVVHCFLIRDPREMLTSLIHNIPNPTLADTGLLQQVELFDTVRDKTGRIPPVLDSKDVLENPEAMLRTLTQAVGVTFDQAMLSWTPGTRQTDGIWAKYWYANVEKSSGFQSYKPKNDQVPDRLKEVHAQCVDCYGKLHAHRLRVS